MVKIFGEPNFLGGQHFWGVKLCRGKTFEVKTLGDSKKFVDQHFGWSKLLRGQNLRWVKILGVQILGDSKFWG